jgi:hypothetical protein
MIGRENVLVLRTEMECICVSVICTYRPMIPVIRRLGSGIMRWALHSNHSLFPPFNMSNTANPSADVTPVNLLALGPSSNYSSSLYFANRGFQTDGGGIRGVSELVILHEIMKRIQFDMNLTDLPRPCDYFHLIGGTSTGG